MARTSVFFCVALALVLAVAQATFVPLEETESEASNDWQLFQDAIAVVPENDKLTLSELGWKISKFTHSSCSGANSPVKVNNLAISSDLRITASLTVKSNVTGPLQVEVGLFKKMFVYVKVFNGVVSKDICVKLANQTSCPVSMVANNLPCKCPFSAGTYSVVNLDIDITKLAPKIARLNSMAGLIKGDYKIDAKVTKNGAEVACAKVAFSLSK